MGTAKSACAERRCVISAGLNARSSDAVGREIIYLAVIGDGEGKEEVKRDGKEAEESHCP